MIVLKLFANILPLEKGLKVKVSGCIACSLLVDWGGGKGEGKLDV